MLTKYAVRITEANLEQIRAQNPVVDVNVKEDQDRYFLYTVDSELGYSTEHDIVHGDDLALYDGDEAGTRIVLQ